ncbi:hypothetical protein SteCoe_29165 [Stentor coeruleus]|uniref:Uncharacterized protein n=1 Tax=Stentor coeruleus TaxID=5963 RepID=A0A1R2B6L5_9CILI|nr:hypothetical protein SteCoe_29165 [Stentor coeruleus]
MDFCTQKISNNINIPLIVNKLLVQQSIDKEKQEEKLRANAPKHIKANSLCVRDTARKYEICKSDYVKAKRALYDHTRSLRHYDGGFSISTMLSTQKDKPLTCIIKDHPNNKPVTRKSKFRDIVKKTEWILEHAIITAEKSEIKNASRCKILSNKPRRIFTKVTIEIPSVRAQTILPCPRKKHRPNMVDQEIATDYYSGIMYNN